MSSRISRRRLLKGAAATGAGFFIAGSAPELLAVEKQQPADRLRVAGIGVGGKGSSDIDQAGAFAEVVALCDIDDKHLGQKAAKFPQARKFNDFRKMFDEMAKSIDAVIVSTPDHTHAIAAITAMKLGKHVYVQKPLTHTVFEARLMRETARKMHVCSQMGNQGSASDGLRKGVEAVQAGLIGKVTEAHVWTNRPIWPQAPAVTMRPKETPPVPENVHWDEFLGPAPERPYHPCYHPFAWRGWLDFGTGALGDMACHTANLAFRALKLGYPSTVAVVDAGNVNEETYPGYAHIVYEFPARGEMPACQVHWYEGKKEGKKVLPPEELLAKVLKPGEKLADSGSLLVGDKGLLFSPNDYGESWKLLPEEDFKGVKFPEPTLPRNGKGDGGMKEEWIKAIKEGKPEIAYSNFDIAGVLTEFVLLGNVAIRVGKKFTWDGPNLKSPDVPQVAQFLRMEYRKGWTL